MLVGMVRAGNLAAKGHKAMLDEIENLPVVERGGEEGLGFIENWADLLSWGDGMGGSGFEFDW